MPANTTNHLLELPVLLLDCQTTGATPEKGHLLEIAWSVTRADQPQLTEVTSHIIAQPQGANVPYRIQSMTGITTDMMERATEPAAAATELSNTVNALKQKPYLALAHFARFEQPFVNQLLDTQIAPAPLTLFCTYEIAKRLYPNLPSKGIKAVAGFFGTVGTELKRARSHVECTHTIWRGLVEHLSTIGVITVDQLLSWLDDAPVPKRGKYQYPLEKSKRLALPDQPGVYRMLSRAGDILYVGKATSLQQRVNSYFRGQTNKDQKTRELLSQVYDLRVTPCLSPLEAALLETDEIKRHDPPYNRMLKRGGRALVFYSPNFSSMSHEQSAHHPIGPFPSDKTIEPLLKIDRSLQQSSFAPDIFYSEIASSILEEGFKHFCIDENVEPADMKDARTLLSVGLWLYRRRLREQKAEEANETETPEDDNASETDDEHDTEPEHGLTDQLTPAELGIKFARVMRRMARSYLRAKALTTLLHTNLTVEHKSTLSHIAISRGTVTVNGPLLPSQPTADRLPWHNLDLDTYDRMTVVLSHINSRTARVGDCS